MKKTLALLLAIFIVAPAVFAAPKDNDDGKEEAAAEATPVPTPAKTPDNKPVDRLDMSLYGGGGFTQLGAASGGVQQVQAAGGAAVAGLLAKQGGDAAAAVPEYASASGASFDLMSIFRSKLDPVMDINLDFSLFFGDYGNFGLEAIYYMNFFGFDDYFSGMVGLDLAFEIFPLGNSPIGAYAGPLIGARMIIPDPSVTEEPLLFALDFGAAAGYRLNLGGFVIDAGFIFDYINSLSTFVPSSQTFWLKLSIGGMFEEITPDMVKKKEKPAEQPVKKNSKKK
jgi:hypothetical protein